jgi:ankyrin repeat protein
MKPSFAICLFLTFFLSIPVLSIAQDEDEVSTDSPLMKAVKANNLTEVKKLVTAGAVINEDDDDMGWNNDPVDVAILQNYKPIALYLLEHGATSRRYFYTAVESGDISYIKTLLQYGYTDSEAVLAAVESKNTALVDFLIDSGFPVNFSQKRRTGLFRKEYVSPLDAALYQRNGQMVLSLVKGGVSVTEAYEGLCGFTDTQYAIKLLEKKVQLDELHYISVEEGNVVLAKRALALGANPNYISEEGLNVMHAAVKSGDKQMITYVQTDCHLDFSSKTSKGANCWMLAAESNNAGLFMEMIELPAFKIEDTDANGETILFYASHATNTMILSALMTKNPNINHQNNEGVTAPMKLLWNQKASQFDLFKGLPINYKLVSNDGVDLLGYYLVSGYVQSNRIQELVALGCDPKRLDKYGKNLAYHAVEMNDLELLKTLRSWGVSVDPQDKNGNRPDRRLNSEMIQYILTNGGSVERKTETWDETYLESALKAKDVQIFAFLLRIGANPNQSTKWEKGIVFLCIDEEYTDFLKILLPYKINLQVTNTWGKNPLEIAIENGNEVAVNLLRQAGAKTKSEWAAYEIERNKEMASINSLVSAKNLPAIKNLCTKYADLKLTDAQRKELIIPAIQQNNLQFIELLFAQGLMATDIVNFEQQNLVHICAKEGKLDLMKLFVNKGADPKGKDAFDKLPIEYAKDKEIKSYLKTFGK